MPVRYQERIRRSDLQDNPDTLYLFGDNAERQGLGGQAREMRGEHNAIGIRTKRAPRNNSGAFFAENAEAVTEQNDWMSEDFEPVFTHLARGGDVVVPTGGLGTGLANLREASPSSWDHLMDLMRRMEDC